MALDVVTCFLKGSWYKCVVHEGKERGFGVGRGFYGIGCRAADRLVSGRSAFLSSLFVGRHDPRCWPEDEDGNWFAIG